LFLLIADWLVLDNFRPIIRKRLLDAVIFYFTTDMMVGVWTAFDLSLRLMLAQSLFVAMLCWQFFGWEGSVQISMEDGNWLIGYKQLHSLSVQCF